MKCMPPLHKHFWEPASPLSSGNPVSRHQLVVFSDSVLSFFRIPELLSDQVGGTLESDA